MTGNVEIFQEVQIKERTYRRHGPKASIAVGDGSFIVEGQGFALIADDNRIRCQDEESYAIECRYVTIHFLTNAYQNYTTCLF